MRPGMLDPARDLAGATPETLTRALFRRVEPLRPRPGGEPVVGDELPVAEATAHEPGDGLPQWSRVSDSRTLCLPANSLAAAAAGVRIVETDP